MDAVTRPVRRRMAASVAALLLTATAACGEETPPQTVDFDDIRPPASAPALATATYVAMGDSTAAGMGIPWEVGPRACQRSTVSYPHLLAQEWDLDWVDVTCTGATVAAMTEPQARGTAVLPAQAQSVTRATRLVTLTFGGHEIGYLQFLDEDCQQLSQRADGGTPCVDRLRRTAKAHPEHHIDATIAAVMEGVRAVREQAAPDALIVVVGYVPLGGRHGVCADLPVTAGDMRAADGFLQTFNERMRSAAEGVGADFLDIAALAADHGVCAPEPWVNGVDADGDGAPGHGKAVLHRKVAAQLSALLRSRGWTP